LASSLTAESLSDHAHNLIEVSTVLSVDVRADVSRVDVTTADLQAKGLEASIPGFAIIEVTIEMNVQNSAEARGVIPEAFKDIDRQIEEMRLHREAIGWV